MAAEAEDEQRLQRALEVLELVFGQNGFRLLDAQQIHEEISRRMDFESHDDDDDVEDLRVVFRMIVFIGW